MSDLNIIRLSHCSASISGGLEAILLCDRITKDDIQVKFFEEQNGQIIWESLAEFQPNDVHKQVAIVFRVPKYYLEFINQPLTVYIQLRRPSDGHLSEPRPFQYIPNNLEQCSTIVRKRPKFDNIDPSTNENKKRNFETQQINEFRVPRLTLNPMQIDNEIQQSASSSQQQLNTLQTPSFFAQQDTSSSPQTHSPDNFNENTNYMSDAIMHSFVKNENDLNMSKQDSPFVVPSFTNRSSNCNTRYTFGQIKEEPSVQNVKAESLELDIDANDLISDINFNNMMINMGSDNNIITFNSSGNIIKIDD